MTRLLHSTDEGVHGRLGFITVDRKPNGVLYGVAKAHILSPSFDMYSTSTLYAMGKLEAFNRIMEMG
jgi:hypothetical protein